MSLDLKCNTRQEYTGDGSKTTFSISFDVFDSSSVYVSWWSGTAKEWVTYPSNHSKYGYTVDEGTNESFVIFNNPPELNQQFIIYRLTPIDEMRVDFEPGRPIKAQDLDDNFNQLADAIEDTRCIVEGYLDDSLDPDDIYWKKAGETVYSGHEWVASDCYIASTAAIQKRLQSLVTISDEPPATPNHPGELWWDSDVADLFIYYDDGNSSQWVSANNSIGDAPSDGIIYGRKDAQWIEVNAPSLVGTLQQVTTNGNTTGNNSIIVGSAGDPKITLDATDGTATFGGYILTGPNTGTGSNNATGMTIDGRTGRGQLSIIKSEDDSGAMGKPFLTCITTDGTPDTKVNIARDGSAEFKGAVQFRRPAPSGTSYAIFGENQKDTCGAAYITRLDTTTTGFLLNSNLSEETVRISSDGSAVFEGDVTSNGKLRVEGSSNGQYAGTFINTTSSGANGVNIATPNRVGSPSLIGLNIQNSEGSVASIKMNGTAEFAGDIQHISATKGVGGLGAKLSASGCIINYKNNNSTSTSDSASANHLIFYSAPDASSAKTPVVRIDNSGSAEFAGGAVNIDSTAGWGDGLVYYLFNKYQFHSQYSGITVGGSTGSPLAVIRPDGTADFKGNIDVGPGSVTSSNSSLSRVNQSGAFIANRVDGGDAEVFQGKFQGSETSRINADGSAKFAGNVTAGSYPAGNGINAAGTNGCYSVRNDNANATNGTEQAVRVYSGGQSQNEITAKINANGSAEFKGDVDITGMISAGYTTAIENQIGGRFGANSTSLAYSAISVRNYRDGFVFTGIDPGGNVKSWIKADGSATFAGNKAGFTAEGHLWCTTPRGDTVMLDATQNGMGIWTDYNPPTRRDEIKDQWAEKNVIRPMPEESSQDEPETPQ